MAKRKTKLKRNSAGSSRARDIAAVWKVLIVFNILVTAFGFFMIYAQNNYIMAVMHNKLPIALPMNYKGTAIVVNPITGQFVGVNSATIAGTLFGLTALIGIYFLLKEAL